MFKAMWITYVMKAPVYHVLPVENDMVCFMESASVCNAAAFGSVKDRTALSLFEFGSCVLSFQKHEINIISWVFAFVLTIE